MSYPLVSICIPTFNGEKFIAEAMNSALIQSYRPLEIIVSDDHSQDDTLKIINGYHSQTEIPIKIFHHAPAGIGANWNNCVMNSSGGYIKFLFQDDILEPTCITKMVNAAINNYGIGLVFCKRKIIYDFDNENHVAWVNKYGELHNKWSTTFTVVEGRKLLMDPWLLKSPSNKIGEPVAVLLKKDVFQKAGYFSTSLKQSLDNEYWYRIFKHYKVAFVNESLASFRLHPQQATSINRQTRINETKKIDKILISSYMNYLHPASLMVVFRRRFLIFRKVLSFINKLY